MQTQANEKTILSKTLKTQGSRTYFFDVKESAKGDKYLLISESRKNTETGKYEHHRVMVFNEDIYSFNAVLQEALREFS